MQDEFRFRPNLSFSFGLNLRTRPADVGGGLQTIFAAGSVRIVSRQGTENRNPRRRGSLRRTAPAQVPLADLVLYQDGLKSYLLLNPSFPAPLFPGDVLTNHPADAVQFAPGLREPVPFSTAWVWSGSSRNAPRWP